MEYIGTVKDNYMFTNKLSGIKQGDIIYNYDKLGKLIEKGHYADVYQYETNGISRFIGSKYVETQHEGTGKISGKYRVVEVLDDGMTLDYLVGKITPIQFAKWEDKYAIKCSLIEKVDMDLNEFYSYRRFDKEVKRLMKLNHKWSYVALGKEIMANRVAGMSYKGKWSILELTRYNGLMKVIKIGDE